MSERLPPKEMAKKLTRLLKKQDPDYGYLKKVFAEVRESLGLKGKLSKPKKLPELLTDDEMKRFCEAVREENHRVHTVMIKLLIYTGVRNSELASILIDDVDVKGERIRIDQGKGKKDRYVPFPSSFKGELAQYIMNQKARHAGILYSLLQTCRLHDINPRTYLIDVLQRIQTHPAVDAWQLTPVQWKRRFGDSPMRSAVDD